MPTFDHHYIPLHPAPATREECHELTALGTLNYDTLSGITLVVRLLGTEAKGVRVIAVALPEAGVGHENLAKWFKQIVETALASIRLTYDQDARPEYTPDGFMNLMTQTDDPEPEYALPIRRTENADWRVNINNVLGVFQDIHGRARRTSQRYWRSLWSRRFRLITPSCRWFEPLNYCGRSKPTATSFSTPEKSTSPRSGSAHGRYATLSRSCATNALTAMGEDAESLSRGSVWATIIQWSGR